MVRPNKDELAYLARYQADLERRKSKANVGMSKAAAAKGSIEDSTSSAINRVKKRKKERKKEKNMMMI
jgi:hypothetical protein